MLLGVCRESRKGDTVRGNTLSEEREETGLLSHKPLTSVFLPSLSAEPERVRSCCTLGLRKLPESPGPGTHPSSFQGEERALSQEGEPESYIPELAGQPFRLCSLGYRFCSGTERLFGFK